MSGVPQNSERGTDDHRSQLPVVSWLHVLRRRWRTAALAVLAGLAVAGLLTVAEPTRYSATAQLFFRTDEISQATTGQFVQQNTAPAQDPTTVAATNLRLLRLPVVAQRAATLLGDHYTGKRVRESVKAEPEGQSTILGVTATDPHASVAARIANAYATAFLQERQQADRAALLQTVATLRLQIQALPPAQRGGQQGQLLSSREQDLTILASLQTGGAELAQAAQVPDSPSSPHSARNLLFGLFGGLVLAGVAAALREHLDRRIHDPAEARSLFGRPLLGALPRLDRNQPTGSDELRDSLYLILSHLRYFNSSGHADDEIRVVMVTSAEAEDGKTTLAWNLAVVAASGGRKTVLLEADLRRPALQTRYKLGAHESLSDVLAGLVPWRDAIQTVNLNGYIRDNTSLDVIMGSRVLNPDDLITSDRLPSLLKSLRQEYDFVVIDSAPPTMVAESLPLVSATDGIIPVVRMNKSVRVTNELLRDQLGEMNGRVLGIVVNDVTRFGAKYSYGYTGGYS